MFRRGLEHLEPRCLLSALAPTELVAGVMGPAAPAPAVVAPEFGLSPGFGSSSPTVKVNAGPLSPPAGTFSPAQLQSAYGFSASATAGKGTTIAIIDPFNDPNIQGDLQTFSARFGLSYTAPGKATAQTLTVLNQNGQTGPLPAVDTSGSAEMEESLDVEYAHAMAPGANLVLIEAADSSESNVLGAILAADQLSPKGAPVVAVSMSFSLGEFATQARLDATYFSTPGITYFASAGDSPAEVSWPSSSANVVSVGGTALTLTGNGTTYGSESAWLNGGGGPSTVVPQPTYQSNYAMASKSPVLAGVVGRTTPDVSYDADSVQSPVAVFDSFTTSQNVGFGPSASIVEFVPNWVAAGGTSAGTPQWAAIAADVDSIRLAQPGGTSLSGATQFLPALYAIGASASYTSDFHDVNTGFSGFIFNLGPGEIFVFPENNAGPGYDLVTGLGSPNVTNLIPALVGTTGSGSSVKFTSAPAPASAPKVTSASTTPMVKATDVVVFTTVTSVTFTAGQTLPSSLGQTAAQPGPAMSTPAPVQPVSVVVVGLSPAAISGVNPSVVVINPPSPAALTATGSTAAVLAATTGAGSGGTANLTAVTQTTTLPVLPPQPLPSRALHDPGPLRLHEEPSPLVPIEVTTPALGWEFAAHAVVLDGLDLLAIARNAAALGQVSTGPESGPGAALESVDAPIPTDLNVRPAGPALDPVLAGAVVTLAGALMLGPDRAGRRQRLPAFGVERRVEGSQP